MKQSVLQLGERPLKGDVRGLGQAGNRRIHIEDEIESRGDEKRRHNERTRHDPPTIVVVIDNAERVPRIHWTDESRLPSLA